MGLLSRLFGKAEVRSATSDSYAEAFGINPTSGYSSPRLAENLATVTACVNALAGGLGSLPAYVYRVASDGRTEMPLHPLSRLVRRGPNRHQTWADFIEFLVAQMVLQGNALAVIEHDTRGELVALQPIPWSNVQVSLLPSGRLAYDVTHYTAPWGGVGTSRRYLSGEVLHIRDRSDDGILGRSRISRAPAALTAANGLQEFSEAVWQNSARPSGMVSLPPGISPEGAKRMRAQFEERNIGRNNAGKLVWADGDAKFVPFSVSPEDAEVLASRRFSVEELCRLFNVPPPIVQDYTHNTFTNAAQANTWFATNSLAPLARKIEAEVARTILAVDEVLELDMSALLRGDAEARWQSHKIAVEAGILAPDEVREIEGWKPRGDTAPRRGVGTDPA